MTHGYKLDFREKSDVLDFARLLFSGDYDYGYDYGNEFAHTAASFDEKYRPIYRPALIFSDAFLFVCLIGNNNSNGVCGRYVHAVVPRKK